MYSILTNHNFLNREEVIEEQYDHRKKNDLIEKLRRSMSIKNMNVQSTFIERSFIERSMNITRSVH